MDEPASIRQTARGATGGSWHVIPNDVSEVTPEWLTAVLRTSQALPSGRVTSIDAVPLGDRGGLMSRVVRLVPAYDNAGDAPASLIA